MNRFTNNLYDSEIGSNVEESTLGLAQYGGATSFMDYATDTLSSIKNDSIDTKDNITNAAKEFYDNVSNNVSNIANNVSNIANAVKNTVVNAADHFINGSDKLSSDKLTSIGPLMTENLPNQTNGGMTNSQRLNYQSNQNNLGGSATMSLYNNLNKIVGGCNCKKQYCGGFKDDYSGPGYQVLPETDTLDENDPRYSEIETRMRSNTFDLPDSPYQTGGVNVSSTEEIMNKIHQITGGCDCNKQYCGGDPKSDWDSYTYDMPSEDEDDDDFELVDFENDDDDLPSDSEDDNEKEELKEGGAKSKSMKPIKPGFSNFINGLYKECKMKGGKKKFNPEAIEWNKKTNEFIQTNFKIDDWDKIKIIKFVANTKNKKEIGEDKLKALSDVERAKMLYNTVSSMKPAEIKKIDFKKIQAQRVKILKEKFGDKYREPTKKEDKKEEPKKTTTKKSTKKGGNDNLFLGGEDSESIRLPGGFRY